MKRWLAVVAIAAAAPRLAAADPTVRAPTADLREKEGVCADEIQGVTLTTYLQPIVCIGIGTPGSVSDQHDPWLRVEVHTDARHQADIREWRLTVVGPDDHVLVDRKALSGAPARKPARGCSGPSCQRTAVQLKGPDWKTGKYVFRLMYEPDPEIVSELSIILR